MTKKKKTVKKSSTDGQGDILRIAEYLEANGWRVVVIGDASVQQPLGSFKYNYELVVKFTGSKKAET